LPIIDVNNYNLSGNRDIKQFKKEMWLLNLGTKDYKSALDLQRKLWELRARDSLPDTLILVEHAHTITFGKSSKKEDLLLTDKEQQSSGLSVYEVDRGGEYTYHGPGQLVGYPIMRLGREPGIIALYIARLEEVIIKTLGEYNIIGDRRADFPGVWIKDKKICSIGISVRKWITYHGFALNVNTDLSYFRYIRPCGQDWRIMTSMAQILATDVNMEKAINAITYQFSKVFNVNLVRKNHEHIVETTLVSS
jgi:lipoate-protein ligase B